jgi:hypothetical protein
MCVNFYNMHNDLLHGVPLGSDLTGQAQVAMLKTAMAIYCDLEHPENTTSFTLTDKSSTARTHREVGWIDEPIDLIKAEMFRATIREMYAGQPWPGKQGVPMIKECKNSDRILAFIRDNEAKLATKKYMPNFAAVLASARSRLKQRLGKLPAIGQKDNIEAKLIAVYTDRTKKISDALKRNTQSEKKAVKYVTVSIQNIRQIVNEAPLPDVIDEEYIIKFVRIGVDMCPNARELLKEGISRISAKTWEAGTTEEYAAQYSDGQVEKLVQISKFCDANREKIYQALV